MSGLLALAGNDRRRVFYWAGIACCVLAVCLLVAAISRRAVRDQREVPAAVGGFCAILATLMSALHILEHLALFGDPECQTKVVRILFMVPLYAVSSWLSILLPATGEYLALVRDAYESYAIYAFFSLMLAEMGGVDTLYRALMAEERPSLPHVWPFHWCFEPMKVSPRFVQKCRLAVFQFMICKPVVSLVIIVLTAKGQMGDDLFDLSKGYFWATLVYNVSITIAFAALLYFYMGLQEFLEGKNALSKFMCVKAIIFMTYWQGLIIAILAAFKALPKFNYWTEHEAPGGLQDFLICIEMLIIAFLHKFCFPTSEFTAETDVLGVDDESGGPGNAGAASPNATLRIVVPPARRSIASNLKYTLGHEDIIRDLGDIVHRR